MTLNKNFFSNFIFSFFATSYGLMLASFPHEFFRDRENYIIYAEESGRILEQHITYLSVLFNEPLFLLVNNFLYSFLSSDLILKVYVFFISFTFCFFVLKLSKNWLTAFFGVLLLFFVNHLFHLQLVVLRQGLAVALLMWIFYFNLSKFYISLLVFFLGFIHSSFFLIFIFFFVDYLYNLFYNNNKLLMRLVPQIILTFVLAFSAFYVANILEVRQVEVIDINEKNISGGAFIFWSFTLIFLVLKPKKDFESNEFLFIAILGLVIYLILYFLTPIAGRMIGTFLPFVVIAMVQRFRYMDLALFLVVFIVHVYLFFNGGIDLSLTSPLATIIDF